MTLAFVTGASRGIGRAIALMLAGNGIDVVATYCSQTAEAESLVQAGSGKIRCFKLQLDSPDAEEQIALMLSQFGCPDILVNNAGYTKDGMFARTSRDVWENILAVNLTGFFLMTKPVVRAMLKNHCGSCIVNIASLSGQRGNAGQVAYAASKAGLIGATKALALELAPRRIRVNAVAPGLIDTDMLKAMPQAALEAALQAIPMGRLGSSEDVAAAVAFLCSDAASYITGQVLAVNGGLYT